MENILYQFELLVLTEIHRAEEADSVWPEKLEAIKDCVVAIRDLERSLNNGK